MKINRLIEQYRRIIPLLDALADNEVGNYPYRIRTGGITIDELNKRRIALEGLIEDE